MNQLGFDLIAQFLKSLDAPLSQAVYYRGHADASWEMVPSISRANAISGIGTIQALSIWKRRAGPVAGADRPRSDLEWLVLAQHYGIPTPLMDWTTNPLVALFFACTGEPKTEGCVWKFQHFGMQTFEHLETVEPFSSARTKAVIIETSSLNRRSTAQHSIMTLHPQPSSISEGLSSRDREGVPTKFLSKLFSIPANEKGQVLSALEMIGFGAGRIFTDLNSIAPLVRDELIMEELFTGNPYKLR